MLHLIGKTAQETGNKARINRERPIFRAQYLLWSKADHYNNKAFPQNKVFWE